MSEKEGHQIVGRPYSKQDRIDLVILNKIALNCVAELEKLRDRRITGRQRLSDEGFQSFLLDLWVDTWADSAMLNTASTIKAMRESVDLDMHEFGVRMTDVALEDVIA